jgi:hypothetical protein
MLKDLLCRLIELFLELQSVLSLFGLELPVRCSELRQLFDKAAVLSGYLL